MAMHAAREDSVTSGLVFQHMPDHFGVGQRDFDQRGFSGLFRLYDIRLGKMGKIPNQQRVVRGLDAGLERGCPIGSRIRDRRC